MRKTPLERVNALTQQRKDETDGEWRARVLHSSSPRELIYSVMSIDSEKVDMKLLEVVQMLQAAKTVFWTRAAVMMTALSLPISIVALIRS